MKNLFILALLLCLASMASSAWTDTTASRQLCFNITSNATIHTGAEWTIVDVALPLNGTFFQSSLNANGAVFLYAENSTDAFVMLHPESGTYCIYSGGVASNSLSAIAFGYMDGTSAGNLYVQGSPTYSGGEATFMCQNTASCRFYKGTASYLNTYKVKAKMHANQTATSSNKSGIGNSNNWFVQSTNWSATYGGFTYVATPNTPVIVSSTQNSTYQSSMLRDANGTLLNSSKASHAVDTYNTQLEAIVSYSNASYDWIVLSRQGNIFQTFTAINLTWDAQDANISIQLPSEGARILISGTNTVRVNLGQAYDNCSIYVNGVHVRNMASSGLGPHTELLTPGGTGARFMMVSCYLGGVESHSYRNYHVISAPVSTLFTKAFGYDITASCTGDSMTGLSACTEAYRIPSMYNFSAVVCQNLNTSIDYACLGVSNATKGIYTIFYSPSTWQYATALNVQHVGAEFYYNNAPVSGGMELVDNTTFVYIPGQQKPKDCDVFYVSNSFCANGWGFTVNDRQVVISDSLNNWYLAAGNGITQFNSNYTQVVIPVSVIPLPLIQYQANQTGFYTRLNCYVSNATYVVQIESTVSKLFSITTTGSNPQTYQITGNTLYDNIPIQTNDTVNITADGQTICFLGQSNNLFLPFSLAGLGDGFGGFFAAIFMLFSVILSSAVPYALVIPFMLNDIYHLVSVGDMSIIVILAMVGGILNNVFALERGIKNMVILLAVAISFLVVLGPYTGQIGVDFGPLTNLLTSFNGMISVNGDFVSVLWTFITGVPAFVINLFVVVLTVPSIVINILYALLLFISPQIATGASPFMTPLIIGAQIVYMLKAYEILSNRFRNL